MIVLGLTGSIGMGKATTARLFAQEGAWVHDADHTVHGLYAEGGAAIAPTAAFERLEAIVHPLVARSRDAFVQAAAQAGAEVIVLDVPLLFETGGHQGLDAVVVVSAPDHLQRRRVLERPGMTPARFEHLVGRQVPDREKRSRADFVIDTSQGVDHARLQVRQILATVQDPAWRLRRGLAGAAEASH